MSRSTCVARPFRLLDLPTEIRRMIYSEILGNRLIHLSHHFIDGCERACRFPVATISKAEARLLVNATDHWSLLVCDPSLATAVEEDSDEEASISEDESETSEEAEDEGFSVDIFTSDEDETLEVSEDEGLRTEAHTIDEDGTVEASEDDVRLNEQYRIGEDGNGEMGQDDSSSSSADSTVYGDGIRVAHLDENGSDGNTVHSDDQSDWEEQQEMKKARSLIGHINRDLLSYGWAFHKDRLGFGFTCARPEEGRSDDSIYEREMHLCILRTCRQVYTEATQVLWESNIFSFNDAFSFHRFMDSRDALQIASIRKLRLTISYGWSEWYSIVSQAPGSLPGLRELWLSINDIPTMGSNREYGQLRILRRFRVLRGFLTTRIDLAMLVRVEVAFFSKDLHEYAGPGARSAWNKQERQEYAEVLREMLLSPNGVDLVQRDIEKHGLHELQDH